LDVVGRSGAEPVSTSCGVANEEKVNSDVIFGPPPILGGEEAAYDELIGGVYATIKPVDVIDEMLIAGAVAFGMGVLALEPPANGT
jgi:hypothetical protein